MPPVTLSEDVPGLDVPSLALDTESSNNAPSTEIPELNGRSVFSPMDVFRAMTARSITPTTTPHPGKGSIPPNDINMAGLMALFAIIGASFVLAAIWFFFWAKNGGFVWRKGDWEEYKSTVLRRKGPDGRTLSNATKSTKLGGGSIVHRGYSDDGYTVTDMTETVDETATTVTEEKPKRKKKFKETAKQKILRRRREEKWEGEVDEDVRAYRHEKPARVGGINREPDGTGTYYGSEYTTSNAPTSTYNTSEVNTSEVTPSEVDEGHRNQRSVSGFSFTAGSEDILSQATEEHHLRDPSSRRSQRRHQRSRASRSRHSSHRRHGHRSSMPGGYTEPLDFSSRGSNSEYQYSTVETDYGTGTRTYHHPIPELSKGYRREGGRSRRRDSLSDSE
ncbi:hypothetical protein VTN96DRAFT_6816 [Rasamsonia emersonii]|uniref:Endosomal SPRY domain protein n=1 Tax=Rasamsonia emersonii (strain ATCC 16479 / CBS 393.64 / IMI 116815) TaxID=1408163 RepID=A0A0F4YYI0_RASE3|nr:hypothetical protein T310_3292 [Rasamsonia emersonii CBS 393.64]KKA22673.1 hypothetical protein T310_3292 [Rasamsonia emersonii CBS 393.64]